MDRSNNGAYSRTQDVPSGWALGETASAESQSPHLQKKRSHAGVRNANQPLPATIGRGSAAVSGYGATPGLGGGADKARKGSLRNAVRKIFGRRSKEGEAQLQQKSPPRHGYHRSEPPALAPAIEAPELSPHEDYAPYRTLSAPMHIIPSPALQRTRSPYAVEFPQSARLKPLNLVNPFSTPGSQLTRRKTLPSVLIPESEAAALSASIGSSDPPPVPSLDISRDTPTPEVGYVVSSIVNAKRISRSADDLKGALAKQSLPRKRSDEIRYWRESFQPSVFRTSGFMSKVPVEEEDTTERVIEDRTPVMQLADPFHTKLSRSGTLESSPVFRQEPSPGAADMGSLSGIGTELSRDLEDRVAKLEAGLQHFQRSLQRLTNDRNRRTVIMGGVPQSRSQSDARTPSMLADTLADFAPSTYQYDYQNTQRRPLTSPQPPTLPQSPRTPVRSTETMRPRVAPMPERVDEPFFTPPPPITTSLLPPGMGAGNGHSGRSSGNGQTPQYTFGALYDMLNDERSARRRLEGQLRGMKQEIYDLQYQVSVGSHVQSQRSSTYAPLDPMVGGSSRLRDLLRENESSPPGTSARQAAAGERDSSNTGFSSNLPGVVSRFSGSESEAGTGAMEAEAEEPVTPYEAYQTPREEQTSRYPWGEQRLSDGEMF
ncbi:hypothetical protein LTR36_001697 [Oleoguttula mirabilis]|uniref:Uncharacterized protein n=1 Tax=Oleoguttula mirabilis TaxID=1507867 RepID=A0AAV9JPP4_9PEZI|nr:hypothetical protein LTR36_001697 [Oleoguttula mirabilis]